MSNRRGVNERAFDELNSERVWMLGWMFADSYFRRYNSSFQLQLTVAKGDGVLLDEAQRLLGSHHAVADDRDNFKICISGLSVLGPRLIELGLTPWKQGRGPPNIPERFNPDFIRGFFDGDGYISHTISEGHPRISMGFRGPEKVVKWIHAILQTRGMKGCLHYDIGSAGQPLYRAVYSTGDAFRFYQFVYYPSCLCLERKRLKFEEWFL